MKQILTYIDAAFVLHTILIDLKDDMSDEGDCSDDVTVMDDPRQAKKIPEEKRLFEPVPDGAPRGWRQDQLKDYIYETEIPQNNFNHRSNSFSDKSWESIQNQLEDEISLETVNISYNK